MALRPKAIFPSPPENTIVRGLAVNFLVDFGGTTPTTMAVQIAENRTDAGCNYWKYNGSTLTAATGPSDIQSVTGNTTISFSNTAFNSLTKNNGYRWRVKNQTTGLWSDWQLFFTAPSTSFITITQPTGGASGERSLTVKFTNSGPSLVAVRVKILYSATTKYDQTHAVIVPTDGSGQVVTNYPLLNDYTYTVSVQPKFFTGAWGTAATQVFKASFVRLSTPTHSVAKVGDFVTLTFTSADTAVNPVVSNDLYRWSPQRNEYVLLQADMNPSFVYTDSSAPVNVEFWYRIVSKSTLLSDVFTTPAFSESAENWFITDGTTRLNVVVLSAEFSKAHVLDHAEPLGRTRKVVSRFESGSREVKLTLDIRPEERDTVPSALYAMADSTVHILSPFGDTFTGNITSITMQDDIYGSGVMTLGFVEEVAS